MTTVRLARRPALHQELAALGATLRDAQVVVRALAGVRQPSPEAFEEARGLILTALEQAQIVRAQLGKGRAP
jgi:hypothetical protein